MRSGGDGGDPDRHVGNYSFISSLRRGAQAARPPLLTAQTACLSLSLSEKS